MIGGSAKDCLVLASRATVHPSGWAEVLASQPSQHLDLCHTTGCLAKNEMAEWMTGLNNIPPPAKWNMSERRNRFLGNRNNKQGRNAGLTYRTHGRPLWQSFLLPLCPGINSTWTQNSTGQTTQATPCFRDSIPGRNKPLDTQPGARSHVSPTPDMPKLIKS